MATEIMLALALYYVAAWRLLYIDYYMHNPVQSDQAAGGNRSRRRLKATRNPVESDRFAC